MVFIPPSRDFAFQATATHSQAHAEASSSGKVADPLAPLDPESGSVNVTYQVVWTAGEPPSSHPPRLPQVKTTGWPQPPWSQAPAFVWPPRVSGSVHIIGSPPGGKVWGNLRKEGELSCLPASALVIMPAKWQKLVSSHEAGVTFRLPYGCLSFFEGGL